jgi:hypothetical protein
MMARLSNVIYVMNTGDLPSDTDDGDTLVFEQGSTDANGGAGLFFLRNHNTPDDEGELDFAAADSSEPIGETVTFTATIYPTDPTTNDISPWTVTHGGGGS